MTKALTVVGQKIGKCVDYDSVCSATLPCRKGAKCVDSKFCEDVSWCPSIGYGNADAPPPGTVLEAIEGLEHTVLELKTGISFPSLGNFFFVTGASLGAKNPYRNI